MRNVSIVAAVFLAALSFWLWSELRETQGNYSASVVTEFHSKLVDSHRVEKMLHSGEIDEAIAHLEGRRDLYVIVLGDVRNAISKPSWRWKDQSALVDYVTRSYEAELESVLSNFAQVHGYQLRIARVHPTNPDFSIIMWRLDSMILGGTPFELDLYHFGVYPAKEGPRARKP